MQEKFVREQILRQMGNLQEEERIILDLENIVEDVLTENSPVWSILCC